MAEPDRSCRLLRMAVCLIGVLRSAPQRVLVEGKRPFQIAYEHVQV